MSARSTLTDNSENGKINDEEMTSYNASSNMIVDSKTDSGDIVENGSKLKNGVENGHFTYVDEEMGKYIK